MYILHKDKQRKVYIYVDVAVELPAAYPKLGYPTPVIEDLTDGKKSNNIRL
jgi:hypothetical protein